MPTGCTDDRGERRSQWLADNAGKWFRDTWGERNANATTAAGCLARRKGNQRWCHRDDVESQFNQEESSGSGVPQWANRSCPAAQPPAGVLYNHVSKTGGTSIKHALRQLLPWDSYYLQDDYIMPPLQVSEEDAAKYLRGACWSLLKRHAESA